MAACLAAAAFAEPCVLVLRASPYLPQPDNYAYRASIVAMTDRHLFALSGAQAHALADLQPRSVRSSGRIAPLGRGWLAWIDLVGAPAPR